MFIGAIMEYRQLPHGNEREKFGVLGLGMGGIQHTPQDEIEAIISKAIDKASIFLICVLVEQFMRLSVER